VGSAAATAAPLVLSLSSAEQSAFAQGAGSRAAAPLVLDGDDSNTLCTNLAGQQTLDIDGHGTHFTGASAVTFSVPWITVVNVVVNSPTVLVVTVTAAGAPTGSGMFGATVRTGSEVATGVNIFSYGQCD
jgi:hypothetical protein